MEDPSIGVVDVHEYTNKKCVLMHMRCVREGCLMITNGAAWLPWMRNCFRKGTINYKWSMRDGLIQPFKNL